VQTKYTPTGSTEHIQVIGALPSEVAIGQRVLWVSGVQNKILTITAINGDTITTNGLSEVTVLGGHVVYLDAYSNYFIQTEVYYVNDSSYELIGTFKNKTNLIGQVDLQIASMLKTVCEYNNTFDYDVLNKAIKGEGGKYSIRYSEIYNGVTHSTSLLFSSLQYFTNSTKQIGELYGENMGEYVPTLDDTRPNKAKFLTVFNKPTKFKNMPFALSFIYSDNLFNNEIKEEIRGFDSNGIEIYNTFEVLNHYERAQVNRLMLVDGYTNDSKTFNVWLETTGVIIVIPPLDDRNVFEAGLAEPLEPLTPLPPDPTQSINEVV
jgi:hypothetical protein